MSGPLPRSRAGLYAPGTHHLGNPGAPGLRRCFKAGSSWRAKSAAPAPSTSVCRFGRTLMA